MAGLQAISGSAAKPSTLSERLNGISSNVAYSCERIEAVLARVNSNPQNETSGKTPGPTLGMAEVVQRLEEQAKRLSAQADNLESIA